jgi:hypothetical protein
MKVQRISPSHQNSNKDLHQLHLSHLHIDPTTAVQQESQIS